MKSTPFSADQSPAAFSRVVERLLASPHYGERWGRHWMDVARYADTAGDNADYPIPEAARYRDYIIDSFNADKPYDRSSASTWPATFWPGQGRQSTTPIGRRHRIPRPVAPYATAPFELWHLTLEDTIDTTGGAFLGLTLRCARCHDHKFDPVTQRDYYFALRNLRQHHIPLRRLGRAAFEVVSPHEFRAGLAVEGTQAKLEQ